MDKRSIWVFHLNTGSCNGCDIEILDVLTPFHDVERLGVKLVGSPRHADVILVTGPVTVKAAEAVRRAYEAVPYPKVVVAIGSCACSGGIFYDSYSTRGGVENIIPVDLYVPGCPPRPEAIIHAISLLKGIAEKKIKGEVYREG